MQKVTIQRLRQVLDYDPKTGVLIWKERDFAAPGWNTSYAGKQAFTSDNGKGYRVGSVDRVNLYAHRVAWAIVHGKWPSTIDHIDGDKSNNRISNLRSVSKAENSRNCRLSKNNTSGANGVSWNKTVEKWQVHVTVDRKQSCLGMFDCLDAAKAARALADQESGFHPNHGKVAS